MPLRDTVYGGECPLEKFVVDVPSGAGSYTSDPVEACISCNFSDFSAKEFDLEQICKSPADMTWDRYDKLRKQYATTGEKLTKQGFWKFVEENFAK
jgi:hypothetical protein